MEGGGGGVGWERERTGEEGRGGRKGGMIKTESIEPHLWYVHNKQKVAYSKPL